MIKSIMDLLAQEVKQAIDNHPELKDGFSMWAEEDTLDGRQRLAEACIDTYVSQCN
jgi:hypothetical protein